MTPGKADLAFNIRRAHHLRVQHCIFHVGTEPSKRAICELANLFAPLIPRATRKRVRNILGKDAHRMLPRRSHGCIMDALKVQLAPQVVRQLALSCSGKAGLPLSFGKWRIDLTEMMRLVFSWPCRKSGSSRNRTFSFTVHPS